VPSVFFEPDEAWASPLAKQGLIEHIARVPFAGWHGVKEPASDVSRFCDRDRADYLPTHRAKPDSVRLTAHLCHVRAVE